MGTLTIHRLDERTHARLRRQAAKHGRSVEAEVRAILDAAVDLPEANILLTLHAAFAGSGVELSLPERTEQSPSVAYSELQDGCRN